MKIKISEISPNYTIVSNPIELYAIAEIGKYFHELYNMSLDISELFITQEMQKSIYWDYLGYAKYKKWICGIKHTIKTTQIQDIIVLNTIEELNEDNSYIKNNKYLITITKRTSMYMWSWQLEQNMENRKILHTEVALSLISICARNYVSMYMFGVPKVLEFDITPELIIDKYCISYLLTLSKTMCKLFENFIFVNLQQISTKTIPTLEFYSWKIKQKDLGYTQDFYSYSEKLNEIQKSDIEIGDIVSIYTMDKNNKPKDYEIGKLLKIDEKGITVDCIHNFIPKITLDTQFKKLDKAAKEFITKNLNVSELKHSEKFFEWCNIGIGFCNVDEDYLLLSLSETDDCIMIELPKGAIFIKQNDLIYWTLSEYKYQFDKKRFKSLYFKDTKPYYDLYKQKKLDSVVTYY